MKPVQERFYLIQKLCSKLQDSKYDDKYLKPLRPKYMKFSCNCAFVNEMANICVIDNDNYNFDLIQCPYCNKLTELKVDKIEMALRRNKLLNKSNVDEYRTYLQQIIDPTKFWLKTNTNQCLQCKCIFTKEGGCNNFRCICGNSILWIYPILFWMSNRMIFVID
jgi:hypothetical protein